ncbi:fimbrillin family protein [uncultured Bacteroides sp.]|uniref:fimbrillin family protein n=1 Tax=uncultured Bacteroides sp. TaxID=162156 RepID=UPI002AA8858A|nr:fimbrillin family protein [uncultured Bacteroides sp.]
MIKFKLWSAALLLSLFACNQEEVQQSIGNNGQSAIQFTSELKGVALTRANGATWTANDSIGIYMKKSGEALSENSSINGATNILYSTANGDGNFRSVGTGIYFPEDESPVDFIAYYPQRTLENPYIYPIDITNQNDLEAIDLLYSDNLTSISSRSNALNLAFTHQLSRLIFNVKSTDGGKLTDLKLELSGVKTKASFTLADATMTLDQSSTGTINVKTNVTGTTAIAQAILIPESSVDKITLTIELNGTKKQYALPLTSLEKGQEYSYNLNVTGGSTEVDPEASSYIHWTETPIITQKMLDGNDLLYVNNYMPNSMTDPVSGGKMRNYSMLYSKSNKIAYWVAYPLFPACTGSSGRTDAWDYDPSIPESYQADLSSGFGGNGYDRGHQIPSGDRTCDAPTNRTTFYYSNMTPQIGQGLNQSIWAELENQVRSWRSGTDTVYVVTGAMPPATNVTLMKEMAVPEYYFKAIARRINGAFTTIAFKFENKIYSGSSYMEQVISVKQLEDLTGFTFFPTIDPTVKATLDTSKW